MSRLTLLGVGTCQLEAGRSTSAALIELDELKLVYDFGRGTATRLAELGLRQDDIEQVVVSHFHPDHLSDLIPYLHAAAHSRIDPRTRDLNIYGPPGVRRQIGAMLELFEPTSLVAPDRYEVRAVEVESGELPIGGHTFVWSPLPPAGNHGLKFRYGGTTVALTGDSDFHPQEIEFLRDVDLAVFDSGHLEEDEIVRLAAACGARRMICSHLYRELDADRLTARARALGYAGRIEIGADLRSFEL